MPQASLPFQYAEENRSSGMTALSGLAAYLEMAEAAGLRDAIRRHITVREKGQGWSDVQMVMSLLLLNLAGGESVEDLRILEADEGLGRVLAMSDIHRMRRAERIAQDRRWRRVRVGVCRRRQRCFGTSVGSMTHLRRRSDSRTPRSYPGPTTRWSDSVESMRTLSSLSTAILTIQRRRWIWTRL